MTDIVYLVSHGFAARMVVQTDLLGRLVASGLRIALVVPDEGDEALRKYCLNKGVELRGFSPRSGFWNEQYFEARKYFLEDIRQNPALWEKHVRSTKFNRSRNPWKHIRPRLLFLAYLLTKRFPPLRRWYQSREQRYLKNAAATALIQALAPQLVVATYPVNFTEATLLHAAAKGNIKTSIHLLSWDNITAKGHFPQLADTYISWGEVMGEELTTYYPIVKDNVYVCGVPHFDLHVRNRQNPQPAVYLRELGLDPNKPYLFFGMSAPRFAPREIDIVSWLAARVQQNDFGADIQLVIRPHPQNVQGSLADPSWLPRLKSLAGERVCIDLPDLVASRLPWSMQQKDMERMSQLLAGCTICLNSGSTMSIDALMCGKPVVLTSFDGDEVLPKWYSVRRLISYTHLAKLVATRGVLVADNYAHLAEHLGALLEKPSLGLTEREAAIKSYCTNYEDGAATSAVVSRLKSLVS